MASRLKRRSVLQGIKARCSSFLFLGLLLIVGYPIVPVSGAPPAEPVVGVWAPSYNDRVINDTSLPVGAIVRVDLNITDSPTITVFDIKLIYDFDVLQFLGYDSQTGTVFGSGGQIVRLEFLPPELRIVGANYGEEWPGGSGVLIHLDFIITKAGVSPLGLYETGLFTSRGEVGHLTKDGYFTNDPQGRGPNVNFAFAPSDPVKGQEVTFDATGTFDADNATGRTKGIMEYRWFFGSNDGTGYVVEDPLITHILGGAFTPRSGTFWIRLIAEDYQQHEGLMTRKIVVKDAPIVLDYGLFVSPANGAVEQGSGISAIVTATVVYYLPQRVVFVNFDVQNLPAGVKVNFSPPKCGLSCEATMRIHALTTAETGSFVLVIYGSVGGATRAIAFELTILPRDGRP
jgi:hypothetical protein